METLVNLLIPMTFLLACLAIVPIKKALRKGERGTAWTIASATIAVWIAAPVVTYFLTRA